MPNPAAKKGSLASFAFPELHPKVGASVSDLLNFDRAGRHAFWGRLWLFFSPFLFPSKKIGTKKGE